MSRETLYSSCAVFGRNVLDGSMKIYQCVALIFMGEGWEGGG